MCQTDGCIDFPRIFVIWLALSSKLLKPAFQKLPRLHERILQMKNEDDNGKISRKKEFFIEYLNAKMHSGCESKLFCLDSIDSQNPINIFVVYKYNTRFNQLWNGPEAPKIWIKAILFSPEKELISLQAYETFGWDQSCNKENYSYMK